ASQAEIVDRLTPDRPVTHADDETPEVAHLRQLVEGGKLGEGKLIRQGSSARVTRYTTPGGTRVVEKRSIAVPGSADNPTLDALTPGDDARDRVDAEVLTSRLGRKLKANVPAAFSPSERTVVMEHVPGRTGAKATLAELQEAAASDAGRRLYLVD